jgi:hypothetical protein
MKNNFSYVNIFIIFKIYNMNIASVINDDCTNYNLNNGFGCKFCLDNGKEWRTHCLKNNDGHIICVEAYNNYIQKTRSKILTSNLHTFTYCQKK